MLDDGRLTADEYEKQYYGFSSTELIEDFNAYASEVMKNALMDVKIALSEEKDTSYDKESLDIRVRELYEVYLNSASSSFERFKSEVRIIFAIPKNVLLDEDKLRHNYSDEDIGNLRYEVTKLENELIQEKVYLAKCKQLKEDIEKTLRPVYEKVNNLISVAKRIPKHTDKSEEANQQKILKMHDEYVHYFNMMKISDEQYRSSMITNFKTGDFSFD